MKRDMVAGLVIRNKKILLVFNTKHNSVRIEPPGGKKYDNESWEKAAARELKEELGIEVASCKLFGIYDTSSPEGKFSVHMYFCKISGEPHITEPDKISDFKWFTFSGLQDLKRSGYLVPNMIKALPDLKKYL